MSDRSVRGPASILAAAERVFIAHGYRGYTEARLLEATGVSRTEFSGYFRTVDEPLHEVLGLLTSDLLASVDTAMAVLPYGRARAVAGIDALLSWSQRHRRLLPAIAAEMHDPTSPVSRARRHGLEAMIEMLARHYEQSGRTSVPDRVTLDIFVNSLEHTVYGIYVVSDGTPEAIERARWIMARLAVAVLGRHRCRR